jgi:carbon storage regulator
MLVLSRRANQSIVIGSDVVVTVLEVRGDHVRLGIDAPRTVTVHREEVYAEIQRENRSAATVPGAVLPSLPRPPR